MIRLLPVALIAGAAPALAEPQAVPTKGLYLQLIHQARADGRPRAALAYLDDFDRQYPGDADARALRVNSLIDLGQIDAAEAIPLPADADALRGHLLAARGRWAEAVPCYRAASRGSPADPLLRNALGYALLRSGQAKEAIEAFRGAIDLAPQAAVIRNNMLLALMLSGRRDSALNQIRDADLRRQIITEAARITLTLSKGH